MIESGMTEPQVTETDVPVALVTGAAGGIGSAVVCSLRQAGWKVAGLDRRPATDCDLSAQANADDAEAVSSFVQTVEAEMGPVRGLVTAAGHYESVPFAEVSDEQVCRMVRTHVGGFLTPLRTVLPGMIARGSGSVVAVASELAVGGGAQDSHYSAAKGAVLGAMRSVAAETASTGVKLNAVAPGPTDTPMLPPDSPWRAPAFLDALPTRTLATPEDVAAGIVFLLAGGEFMTGETLHPNSGAVI